MSHGPIEDKQLALMNTLAHFLDDQFNPDLKHKQVGFVLLCFDFGLPKFGSRMNYISNSTREDIIIALKELVANFEGRMMPETKKQ